jgi:hypothetical protein
VRKVGNDAATIIDTDEHDSFAQVYKDLEQTLDAERHWAKRQTTKSSCEEVTVVPINKDPRSPDVFHCKNSLHKSEDKQQTPCTVLSFGIDYDFSIDKYFWGHGCFVDSYDPSMTKNGPNTHQYELGPRHRFFLIGAGDTDGEHPITESNTLYTQNGKTIANYVVKTLQTAIRDIDQVAYPKNAQMEAQPATIVRMDVEGAEWDLLQRWKQDKVFNNVKQLLMEIHFTNHLLSDLTSYRHLQRTLESISCQKSTRDPLTGFVPEDEVDNCLVLRKSTRNFWNKKPLPGYQGNCPDLMLPLKLGCEHALTTAWELVYINPKL